jgi:alcohol dehydrogenase (cytochrome c)
VAFTVALGGYESGGRYKHGNLQATPIVEDGMMYVTDGWGSVYAIDVAGGKKGVIKWKFDPGTDRAWAGDVACCGVNNRGVALWKDKIISISLDGRLFSLNKATGEMVWERKVADPAIAETLTLAPLVVRDLAIVGSAGGEFGIRGWIDATDLNTGKQAWRTFTIPGAGEPGNETWKDGKERWKHGGDRHLRSRKRHLLPGHRQCRSRLGSGIPARRQQMGGERAGAQRDRRQDQMGLSVHPE